ncbi:MAG: hypothetical protein JSV26_06455, partial [bacterium]
VHDTHLLVLEREWVEKPYPDLTENIADSGLEVLAATTVPEGWQTPWTRKLLTYNGHLERRNSRAPTGPGGNRYNLADQ